MGPAEHVKPHPLLTANLVVQLAVGLLATTICLPSMQEWPAIFGAPQAAVQLTFSGFVVAFGGMQLVYGPLSDRLGRKPVLMAGLLLALAGSLAAALAPDLLLLTLARMVQGAGCAAGMVTTRAMVQDLFEGHERTRMMALIGMAMGLCPPLATIIGGQLHVRFGWQANFWFVSLVVAGLLVAAWRGIPNLPPRARPRQGAVRELLAGYGRLLRHRAFVLYVAMLASTTAAFYTFLGGAPIVLKAYGVTPDRVGYYIMCIPLSYMVGNLLTSRLVRRYGDRVLLAWGQSITLASLLLVLGLGLAGLGSPLALALPLLLLGLGHGLLTPATLSGTVGVIPVLAGSAAAIGGVAQQLSGGTGAFVIGLVPHEGQVNLALLMLFWTVIGATAQRVLHGVVLKKREAAA